MTELLLDKPTPAEAMVNGPTDPLRHNALFEAADQVPGAKWTESLRAFDHRVPPSIDDFYQEYTGQLFPQAALDIVYGQRYIGEGRDIKVQSCDIDSLTKINEAIQRDVLEDEHGRIPRVLTPPEPDKGLSPTNNTFWLEQIRDGTWPIMLEKARDSDDLKLNAHDEGDFHLGNMALFPREMQDEITEAAEHTLRLRQEHAQDDSKELVLVLPKEYPRQQDPLSYTPRGGQTIEDRSGINVIDDITDNRDYMAVLGRIVILPEQSADKVAKLAKALRDGEPIATDNLSPEATEQFELAERLNSLGRLIGDITNFNVRHRERRRITDDELKNVTEKFFEGVLRVASKIRGTLN